MQNVSEQANKGANAAKSGLDAIKARGTEIAKDLKKDGGEFIHDEIEHLKEASVKAKEIGVTRLHVLEDQIRQNPKKSVLIGAAGLTLAYMMCKGKKH